MAIRSDLLHTNIPQHNPLESPAPYPHEDEAELSEYAFYARALWDEQEDPLFPLHQVWMQNLLFLTDRQWWRPNEITGIWGPLEVPEWREQPVSNLTKAYYKTFLAKATKTRPAWNVLPASTDPNDIKATELADEVLESKWLELKLGRQLRRAVGWACVTGNAYIYTFWNTETGNIRPLTVEEEIPVYNPETGEQEIDETGELVFKIVEVPVGEDGETILGPDGLPDEEAEPLWVDEGDIGVRVYSPFQVRVNPEADCDEDVKWFIIAETMPLREIINRWPHAAEDVMAEDVSRMEDFDRLIGTVAGGPDTNLVSPLAGADTELPKALVLHYHEKPSTEYPNGRFWISVNKHVILENPQELPEGIWSSLVHLKEIEIPGVYHGGSTIESIVGLNREYNELNAQIKEHHNLLARGKWLVPKGSGIKRGMITTQPGEIIPFNPGFEPKQADLKPLPTPVYQERERIQADFQTVSGIHKISMGTPPPGVTAGVAFLQLQEADDTDFGPFLAMLEETVSQMACNSLKIIQKRYTEERMIYVAGPDRKYLVKTFRGADLEGAVSVVPIAGSSFPWSQTAKQNMLLQMATQIPPLFIDPETGQFDTRKFARLLPIGGLESLSDHEDLDMNEAQREEDQFRYHGEDSNELPQVEFWQNHESHYRSHIRVLKSAEFRDWPMEIQQEFVRHVQETDMARQQTRMQAAMGGGPMPGGAEGQIPPEILAQMRGQPQPPAEDIDPNIPE